MLSLSSVLVVKRPCLCTLPPVAHQKHRHCLAKAAGAKSINQSWCDITAWQAPSLMCPAGRLQQRPIATSAVLRQHFLSLSQPRPQCQCQLKVKAWVLHGSSCIDKVDGDACNILVAMPAHQQGLTVSLSFVQRYSMRSSL